MENFIEILFYIGFAVALGLAVFFIMKYSVTKTQLISLDMILELMKNVNKQFDYKQQDDLERVLDYCVKLTNYLIPYVDKGGYSHQDLLTAILDDAYSFCESEEIEINQDLEYIIDFLANFIVIKWFGVE